MLSCAISLLIFVQDFLFDQYINLIFRIKFIDTFVLYLLPLLLLFLGIIWPLEAIPEWLRYISICLPQTYAAEAMRCVLSRGNHHSKIFCRNYQFGCSSISCISIYLDWSNNKVHTCNSDKFSHPHRFNVHIVFEKSCYVHVFVQLYIFFCNTMNG